MHFAELGLVCTVSGHLQKRIESAFEILLFKSCVLGTMRNKKHIIYTQRMRVVCFCIKSSVSAILTDCAWCFAVFCFITV